jgi:phage gp36-like protein
MATKSVFLGVDVSQRVGESLSVPLSIPTLSLMAGQDQPMAIIKSTVVPAGYDSIQSITLRYRKTGTGNLYMKFAASQTVPTPGSVPVEDSSNYDQYAEATADNSMGSITVPTAAYDGLSSLAEGDALGIAVYRDSSNVLDTYTTDLDVYGFLIVFSVNVIEPVAGAYCAQTDLENRISRLQLAQLTADTANPTQPDSNVVAAIIDKADREIDSKAGQVFVVPFVVPDNCTTIPSLIRQISIDFSIYYCFLRRYSEIEVPKQWIDLYKDAKDKLEDVSNMMVQLDGEPTEVSEEADIVSKPIQLDFYNPQSPLSRF